MNNIEHARELQKYSEFRPTGFDPKGLNCEEYEICEWYVMPVSRTRDSGPFEESNFHTAIEMLGGESDHVQVHRFGHWGPGWFEIIIVDPNHEPTLEIAGSIVCSLADYPILDEEDCSEREYTAAHEVWESCYDVKDRIAYLRKQGVESWMSFIDLIETVRGLSLVAVNDPSSLIY